LPLWVDLARASRSANRASNSERVRTTWSSARAGVPTADCAWPEDGSAVGGGTSGAGVGVTVLATGVPVGVGVVKGVAASAWALRNSFIASPALRASFGNWLPPNKTTTAMMSTYSESAPKMFASTAPPR
jgi:hypothetical protein